MDRLPTVLGLVLCERMDVDPQKGQYSLVNVFNQQWLNGPSPPLNRFTVYAMLFGRRGEGPMELSVIHLQTEDETYKQTKWYASPGPSMSHILEMRIKRCFFRNRGRYKIALRFDGKEIACQYLDVYER